MRVQSQRMMKVMTWQRMVKPCQVKKRTMKRKVILIHSLHVPSMPRMLEHSRYMVFILGLDIFHVPPKH